MGKIRKLKTIWRHWLGSQSPRRSVLKWRPAEQIILLIICLLISVISSYPLISVSDMKVGKISAIEEIAPKDALVTNTIKLEKNRNKLFQTTSVQIIDSKKSKIIVNEIAEEINNIGVLIKIKKIENLKFNITKKEKAWLLSKSFESDYLNWKRNIINVSRRMITQGLVDNIAKDQISNSATLNLSEYYIKSSPELTLGSKLIENILYEKTNLVYDPNRSKKLFDKLINKLDIPKYPLIKKGDFIIKKGDLITQKEIDILSHFGLRINPKPSKFIPNFSKDFIYIFTESLLSCGILILIIKREKPRIKLRQILLPIGMLLIVQLCKLWFGANVSPLAILVPPALLLSQGIGTSTALIWMAIASFIWPIPIIGLGEGRLLIASLSASLVAFLGGRMRSRAQLLQIAVFLPFLALFAEWVLVTNKIPLIKDDSNLNYLLLNSTDYFSEALIVSAMIMISISLIPIIENAFGLLTSARLMELADQERPLLKRLLNEAPGTFEHTLTICGLAEEGARSIRADVDLIRTGALYHDVGKLHAPQWFIENQENGINPHDEIKDPFKSAKILQAHVDEGIRLAKRYRLPSAIIDFIPEHQGTLKMGYFLHKAKQKDKSITESKFRYQGPKPQSKETGILMLADGCEAALRSLDVNASSFDAILTVKKIIESRQKDGQLVESNLTRAEVELISRGFVRVWKRMRHRRLNYPSNSKNNQ